MHGEPGTDPSPGTGAGRDQFHHHSVGSNKRSRWVGWVEMSDDVQVPRWEWDEANGVFKPMCPHCPHELQRSYGRYTCNMRGYRHFKANIDDVVNEAKARLAP